MNTIPHAISSCYYLSPERICLSRCVLPDMILDTVIDTVLCIDPIQGVQLMALWMVTEWYVPSNKKCKLYRRVAECNGDMTSILDKMKQKIIQQMILNFKT